MPPDGCSLEIRSRRRSEVGTENVWRLWPGNVCDKKRQRSSVDGPRDVYGLLKKIDEGEVYKRSDIYVVRRVSGGLAMAR